MPLDLPRLKGVDFSDMHVGIALYKVPLQSPYNTAPKSKAYQKMKYMFRAKAWILLYPVSDSTSVEKYAGKQRTTETSIVSGAPKCFVTIGAKRELHPMTAKIINKFKPSI